MPLCGRVSVALELDLDVDAGGELEAHERVHRLRGRVEDVDQALVRAGLKLLPRVLVDVRGADHARLRATPISAPSTFAAEKLGVSHSGIGNGRVLGQDDGGILGEEGGAAHESS